MADFSFLSDSDNEKAVEELLSQAMDQSVLEQVAAINCSGFTDSILPTQLETRFRKLKSLPAAPITRKPSTLTRNSRSFGSSEFTNTPKTKKIDGENEKIEGSPVVEKGSKVNLEDGFVEKQTKLNVNSVENDVSSKTPNGKRGKTSSFGPISSPSDSWNSSKDCLSPPAKTGCFWCSPKKGFNKKGKENRGVSMGLKWGKDDDLLSDLSTFSSKNQEKLMKKAMEEQEKINREAEKIVKWAKQASARMDVSSIADELSDDDDTFK
ncbi:uncharacterized protein LOC129889524 [Solanum dulcamara]|uniref:uncharacterized protein LOC129889524 n=1 Tax=Solanum dulcamara TaxID=45834 RepID=UPI002486A363|nr:uncharacterized protein LOC129889524 [Solanum dulcamara]XP_055820823.1 uncharacterized protein LOC129889524 [Solanum dulcamara]XP_055820824.1 uncharacterized protein LOC129889524 [Solanum dulcamara]